MWKEQAVSQNKVWPGSACGLWLKMSLGTFNECISFLEGTSKSWVVQVRLKKKSCENLCMPPSDVKSVLLACFYFVREILICLLTGYSAASHQSDNEKGRLENSLFFWNKLQGFLWAIDGLTKLPEMRKKRKWKTKIQWELACTPDQIQQTPVKNSSFLPPMDIASIKCQTKLSENWK